MGRIILEDYFEIKLWDNYLRVLGEANFGIYFLIRTKNREKAG